MKNFIFFYLWRTSGSPVLHASSGTHICTDIVALYEHVQSQPEEWALTCVAEISDTQMDRVKANGILG